MDVHGVRALYQAWLRVFEVHNMVLYHWYVPQFFVLVLHWTAPCLRFSPEAKSLQCYSSLQQRETVATICFVRFTKNLFLTAIMPN